MRAVAALLAGALAAAPTIAAAPPGLQGPVTRVWDGDTLAVAGVAVRLCGIDAPERGRKGAAAGRTALADLVRGEIVTCRPVGAGTPCDGRSRLRSHRRLVMQCFLPDGRDIAGEMVRRGHARDWARFSCGWYAAPLGRCTERDQRRPGDRHGKVP